MNKPENYIGKAALQKIATEGTRRRLVGVEIAGAALAGNDAFWDVLEAGRVVGHLTRCAWSPRLQKNIGLVNVGIDCAGDGTRLSIAALDGQRNAVVVPIPWVPSETKIPTDS